MTTTNDFQPASKPLKTDERGRISIGRVVPEAKGREFFVKVSPSGAILLEPASEAQDA